MRKPAALFVLLPVAVVLCGLAGFAGARIAVGGVRLTTPAPITTPGAVFSQDGTKTNTAPPHSQSPATDADVSSMSDANFINLLNQTFGTTGRLKSQFEYLGYSTDAGSRYTATINNWPDWVRSDQSELLAWLHQITKTLQARHKDQPFVFTVVIDQEFRRAQEVPGPFVGYASATPEGRWRLHITVAMVARFAGYPNVVVEFDGIPGEELNG